MPDKNFDSDLVARRMRKRRLKHKREQASDRWLNILFYFGVGMAVLLFGLIILSLF